MALSSCKKTGVKGLRNVTSKSSRSKEHYLALIYIILAVIFWGLSFISTKIVLIEMPPASIAFFRQIIATGTLLIWTLAARDLVRPARKELLAIAVAGFFGIVLYFIFENFGLQYTTAANASMIVAAVPVFTYFTEAVFFKLKVTFKMFFCLLLSIIGVYFIISTRGRLDFSAASFRGNLLIIGAMACWVVYVLLNGRLTQRFSSIHLILLQSAASVLLFVPFVIPEMPRWKQLTPVALFNLLYLGVCCSAFSYFFYIYGVKRLGATVAAAFLNLIPVVTVSAGFLILQEKLMPFQILGMVLVIISLYSLNSRTGANDDQAPK
jgi:drug/metabolite transporter (DMT)-like permease